MSRKAWEYVVYCLMAPLVAYVLFLIVKAIVVYPLSILVVLYFAMLVYAMAKSW